MIHIIHDSLSYFLWGLFVLLQTLPNQWKSDLTTLCAKTSNELLEVVVGKVFSLCKTVKDICLVVSKLQNSLAKLFLSWIRKLQKVIDINNYQLHSLSRFTLRKTPNTYSLEMSSSQLDAKIWAFEIAPCKYYRILGYWH